MRGISSMMLALLLLPAAARAAPLALMTALDAPHNMQQNGKIIGLATEKLELAFHRAGLPYTLHYQPWPRAYQSALTLPDHCAYSAARIANREAHFKWVGPVARMDWVLFARADAHRAPANLAAVRDALIGGSNGDVISDWLTAGGYHLDHAGMDALNPAKLMAGRFDYWAVSQQRGQTMIAAAGLTGRIVPVLTFGHSELYLACHPNVADATIQRLNDTLATMRQDGSADAIDARYARWPAP